MLRIVTRNEAVMISLLNAYQSYERRIQHGELDHFTTKAVKWPERGDLILAQFGELLIQVGMRLKRRRASTQSLSFSPMTGGKP